MVTVDPYSALYAPPRTEIFPRPNPGAMGRALASSVQATDFLARSLMRRFFMAGTRPRYFRMAHAWRDAAHAYTTPELQRNPATFYPAVAAPRAPIQSRRLNRLRGGERTHVTFLSSYLPFVPDYQNAYARYRENQTVHVRLWRHTDAARPTVVCLHGWMGRHPRVEESVFAASQLYQSGLNVVFVVLPLHGPRRPSSQWNGDLFPSSDLLRTNEAFGQAVTDVRTTLAWIQQQGFATRIGLLGFSLGGYIASIVASLERELDFLIALMTPASLADVVWELVAEHAREHADFDVSLLRQCLMVHCPLSHPPGIPRHRAMLVRGRYDALVGPGQFAALRAHWGEPTTVTFEGRHCIHAGRQDYLRQACAFMLENVMPANDLQ